MVFIALPDMIIIRNALRAKVQGAKGDVKERTLELLEDFENRIAIESCIKEREEE